MDLHRYLGDVNPWWAAESARRRIPLPTRREPHFQRLVRAVSDRDGRSLVLRGPRRVGKTELLYHLTDWLLTEAALPPARLLYADLSDPLLAARSEGPALLNAVLAAWPTGAALGPRVALLDELQLVPEWDRWLKHALDTHPELRVIATGSSSLQLTRGGRESGRGRWDEATLEGLTLPERLDLLVQAPNESREQLLAREPSIVRDHLMLGGSPEYLRSTRGRSELRRHMRTEVDREIAAELAHVVRDVDVTRKLFLTFAQASGSEFARQKLARQLGIGRETLDRHIQGLEDMLLVRRLGPISSTPTGEIRSQGNRLRDDKIYVADPGHVSAFSVANDPLDVDETTGRIHETAVYHALRVAIRDLDCREIGYLNLHGVGEIDFVLALPTGMVGVEVTKSNREDKKLLRARRAREVFGVPLIVVAGQESIEVDGDLPSVTLTRFLLDPVASIRRLTP